MGQDVYRFHSALGAGNVDRIVDYLPGHDRIELDDAAFASLPLGPLSPNAFRTGPSAQDADDRIIYDAATGALYFDADGNGGGAQIQFATLDGAPALTANDFLVI